MGRVCGVRLVWMGLQRSLRVTEVSVAMVRGYYGRAVGVWRTILEVSAVGGMGWRRVDVRVEGVVRLRSLVEDVMGVVHGRSSHQRWVVAIEGTEHLRLVLLMAVGRSNLWMYTSGKTGQQGRTKGQNDMQLTPNMSRSASLPRSSRPNRPGRGPQASRSSRIFFFSSGR